MQGAIFVASIILLFYFFPSEGKFRYHFQEGKPWKYGLLTAPFDFPIYKSEAALEIEYDSVENSISPYFKRLDDVAKNQIDRFSIVQKQKQLLNTTINNIVLAKLNEIYLRGIVDIETYDQLTQEERNEIQVINNNISKRVPVSSLFSIRTAYEELMKIAHNDQERQLLRNENIAEYIAPNLQYDSITTNKIRQIAIEKIAVSTGLVQAGERIVDRGEIISPLTFKILNSLRSVSLRKAISNETLQTILVGKLIVIATLCSAMFLFLYLFRRTEYNNIHKLGFVMVMITAVSIMAFYISSWRTMAIYVVPFAIIPIVVRTFIDSRVALFSLIITTLLCAYVAPFALEFLYLQTTVGMATVFSLRDLTKRAQLVKCAIIVFLTYAVGYIGYTLLMEGNLNKINYLMFVYFAANGTLLLFAYLFIFLIEKVFGFTSNVTLVELSDINSPILRQLSETCPGTFQHSMQVSNIAAEAAVRVGANPQLVRSGALYHDIGKLNNPAFFTENQSSINPHSKISYTQSAQIIIQHVNDGLKLADKMMLPTAIKDFIRTHHGTGKTRYFYNSFRNEFPDLEVDEELFSYPGPNPTTKETAILMMADSVEAASRSLKEYTEESIQRLVDSIITAQMNEGLLKNAPLTFRHIEIIKEAFVDKLRTIYHTRISYPELKQK